MSTAPPAFPARVGGHPAPPAERPELPEGVSPTPVGPRWRAWTAWVALVAGFAGAIAGAIALAIVAAALGASLESPPPSVNILGTVIQDLCLVGAAIFMARLGGRPRPWDFGLRPTRLWPAVGWGLTVWVAFFLFTAAWVAVLGLQSTDDTLPKSLGVDRSDVALMSVAALVCVVAPICEEFFFRGYFFTALRSWRGVLPAAVITGAVFGAIHAGSSAIGFLVPLGFFGFMLCLLYARTGSLYPGVAVHALNNCTAFGVSQHWTAAEIGICVVCSYALIAAIFLVIRALYPMPSAMAPVAAARTAL
ncbi:MAG TPA: CPBP family intramembrane glutamic endopeptidase [Solirubrobacteraceae bacterium]|nr:CPBP family intramembrane glutamic endopeptidase [Solirubrobacteraceae bacterium]